VSPNALEVDLLMRYHITSKQVMQSQTFFPSILQIFTCMQKIGVSWKLVKSRYGKRLNGKVVKVNLFGRSDRIN
jgi:hypothetical protein